MGTMTWKPARFEDFDGGPSVVGVEIVVEGVGEEEDSGLAEVDADRGGRIRL